MARTTRIPAALLLASLSLFAYAQSIYRCGNSYGTTPCDGAQRIEGVAAPTRAEREAASLHATEAKAQAAALERERIAAENAQAQRIAYARKARADAAAQAARQAPAGKKLSASATARKKARLHAEEAAASNDFKAVDASSVGAKKKKKALD